LCFVLIAFFSSLFTFSLVLLVYFSEFLNEIAAKNWMLYSTQQYFDSNGMFISLIFSTPILLNCLFMLARFLYNNLELMTKVKTAQLIQQKKNASQNRDQSDTKCHTNAKKSN
jgi:transmembrane protein 18